jgi:lipid A 3-O-deacylase
LRRALCLLLFSSTLAFAQATPVAPAERVLPWGAGCERPSSEEEREAVAERNARRLDGLRVLFENDMFSGHRLLHDDAVSDRWYTNGVKLIATQCPDVRPFFLPGAARSLADAFLKGRDVQFGYTVGQLMFTPERIDVSAPQTADRYWAGYLYLGSIAQTFSQRQLETLEIDLGVIGPPALAEEAQTFIHRARGFQLPLGWSNQMQTEPTLNVHYLNMYRGFRPLPLFAGLNADFTPHYGAAVGTVFNYVHGGATLRLGDDLWPAPAGTIDIPSLGGIGSFRHRWSVFLRLDARATAYNAFLDGGFFRGDPHPTDLRGRAFMATVTPGLTFETPGWRASLLFNRRSREFNNAPFTRSVQSFGTLNIEIQF